MSSKHIGDVAIEIDGCEEECNVCGGVIPDPVYWPKLGETNNGYCSGAVRLDGFCGGFCPPGEDERHYQGCVCADCSGADLSAPND